MVFISFLFWYWHQVTNPEYKKEKAVRHYKVQQNNLLLLQETGNNEFLIRVFNDRLFY